MKRILYLTHLPWGNIKQRPQFLAEGLANYYIVDVWYRKSNRFWRRINTTAQTNNLKVCGFINIPFERLTFLPLKLMNIINRWIFSFKNINYDSYDCIWITDPDIYSLLPHQLKDKLIVYDCMDDLLEFPYAKRFPKYRKELKIREATLVKRANLIVCSAETLVDKLKDRYSFNRDYVVVNNAITENIFKYNIDYNIHLPNNSFVYIGTISEWLNFDYIINALEEFPEISIVLYGPLAVSELPQHPRLIYNGVIKHNDILSVMYSAKALIMPFVVNDLILSVNPVKLYEYCYSGKPIIAVRYKETEKFADYVYLYESKEDFCAAIKDSLSTEMDSGQVDKMRQFALNNTWKNRIDRILIEFNKNGM